MLKYLYYLTLITLNISSFIYLVDSNRDLYESKPPFNASNYLKLLSKLNENAKQMQNTNQNSSDNILSENVKQMRMYLSGGESPTYQCQYVVFYFGLILSQFIQCIIINEVPFNICLGCSQQYSDLINAYTDLTNSSISNCSNSFINEDKIDLINDFYQNSISHWTNGNCDSCFSGRDGNQNLVVNNDTEYYFHLTDNYTICLKNNENLNLTNTSCTSCKSEFVSINDFYELISTNYSSHVCSDIIDSMKDIRKHWSETLDCPVISKSSLHFLALVLTVGFLPIVLYLTGRLFCVDRNKTLMKQKRLSTYHLGSTESQPLIQ